MIKFKDIKYLLVDKNVIVKFKVGKRSNSFEFEDIALWALYNGYTKLKNGASITLEQLQDLKIEKLEFDKFDNVVLTIKEYIRRDK